MPLFPRKQAWSSWNLFQNQLCWQKNNCSHFEKEDNMNESEAFITQLCGTACLRGGGGKKGKKKKNKGEKKKEGKKKKKKKSFFIFMTLPQNNSPRIKTPYPNLMNLVSNYLEKNILSNTVKNQRYSINNVVEITDQNRCILFGPPRIGSHWHSVTSLSFCYVPSERLYNARNVWLPWQFLFLSLIIWRHIHGTSACLKHVINFAGENPIST